MQDLIFFMEPSESEFMTPLKIGNLYLNRFTIDEDAAFEIMGLHELTRKKFELTDNEWFEFPIDDNLYDMDEFFKPDLETFYSAFENAFKKMTPKTHFHVVYTGFNYITRFMGPEDLDELILAISANKVRLNQ